MVNIQTMKWVIPKENPNKLTISTSELLNSIKDFDLRKQNNTPDKTSLLKEVNFKFLLRI